ncbi:hypothetical protein AZE42_00954 [Rhizopogon vesiculosus]|uniref:Uncharacterized protein n=1 Tax=Rhizopogon vesiculosus TaxID=180088 RepID=A0A1J8Q152_9AGAM|nr:hypothetical protein AZE42_00954 [Rhizopogon vesiculosus]
MRTPCRHFDLADYSQDSVHIHFRCRQFNNSKCFHFADDQSHGTLGVETLGSFVHARPVTCSPNTPAMSFDFVILVMTTFALGKRFRHEALSSLIFRNGLVYFLITSTCNAVPAVLAVLNFNDEMNVIATVPAAVVSAIAAFRAVIRLNAFNASKREKIHNNLSLGDRISTPSLGHGSPTGLVSFLPSYKTMKPEVHVIAERITTDELGSSQSATSKSPYSHERDSDRASINIDSKHPGDCYGDSRSTIQQPQHIHFGSAV